MTAPVGRLRAGRRFEEDDVCSDDTGLTPVRQVAGRRRDDVPDPGGHPGQAPVGAPSLLTRRTDAELRRRGLR